MDFSQVKGLTIPEGNVVKVTAGGVVLWQKVTSPIPSAYQQVEWIQNSWTSTSSGSYIDLGFAFNEAATIFLHVVSSADTTNGQLFGAAENNGKLRCMIVHGTNTSFYGSTGSTYISAALAGLGKANQEMHLKYTIKPGELKGEDLISGTVSNVLGTQGTYTMTNNLYLFAQNYNGTMRREGGYQLKRFQYYDKNDTLICDLYPCYRKADGVIGVYDTVRKLFLTNAGTGHFTTGGSVALPDEYQQVEWVAAENAVGAYIDLGFKFDTAAEITIEVWPTWNNSTYGYPFGSAESSGKRCILSCPYPNGTTASIYAYVGSTYEQATLPIVNNAKNELVLHYQVGNLYGENLSTGKKGVVIPRHKAFTMTSNLYLFAQNYNGAARFGSKRQIGHFSYRDKNGTLICDLYPCYRKSDNVIGAYDTIRELFLTNVGTGSFTKGADV